MMKPSMNDASRSPLRARLMARVAASHATEAGMVTTRRRNAPRESLAAGVTAQTLYRGTGQRPGEPLRVRLIELAAGTWLDAAMLGGDATLSARHREWLVLAGRVNSAHGDFGALDYHATPAGLATPRWQAPEAAWLFLRESAALATPGSAPLSVRDAEAGWPHFAPGIRRRVLWQDDGQAALLYAADPGAAVPRHTHGHDEECLMVQGELFLDDVLLQSGDYQLAPSGTGHRLTQTDTGVVIYAHGDLDLHFF
ncbi:cupin domain-containing protein [Piscinibacter gummiphilus]|uniref:Cupin domain-containing protein n=1 Tax=Piscinibacter gummiphilus TaxID=946333 RepID=A0ABZ0CVB4_9BURK|nr:cupin domain-containing protein [Piscinibacter gummiphilus]WOB08451.1 cupin domain-containing protein [Piscinibacter gummiphilus]